MGCSVTRSELSSLGGLSSTVLSLLISSGSSLFGVLSSTGTGSGSWIGSSLGGLSSTGLSLLISSGSSLFGVLSSASTGSGSWTGSSLGGLDSAEASP